MSIIVWACYWETVRTMPEGTGKAAESNCPWGGDLG